MKTMTFKFQNQYVGKAWKAHYTYRSEGKYDQSAILTVNLEKTDLGCGRMV